MENATIAGYPIVLPSHRACAVTGCERPYTAKGYCKPHYSRWRRHGDPSLGGPFQRTGPLMARFLESCRLEPSTGCWIWTRGTDGRGYGVFPTKEYRAERAYTWIVEQLRGPVPKGYEVDHLCRVTLCVNPKHLEVVTGAENLRRQAEANRPTHCPRGHEYTAENTYTYPDGRHGYCRICHRLNQREWRARQ